MTPDTGETDRIPRPSRRALLLGALGALVAGVAVAAVGFLGAHGSPAPLAPPFAAVDPQGAQLPTFALHDEKPMRAIGKAVAAP